MKQFEFFKNLECATVQTMSDLVEYQKAKVASLTLVQKELFTITILALDAGTGVGPHVCEGDAFLYALDGTGDIRIDGSHHMVTKDECIVMPADLPHAVNARDIPFKFLLIVVKQRA